MNDAICQRCGAKHGEPESNSLLDGIPIVLVRSVFVQVHIQGRALGSEESFHRLCRQCASHLLELIETFSMSGARPVDASEV